MSSDLLQRALATTDPAEALALYRQRIQQGGNVEEVYVALWRIAVLTGNINDFLMASVYRPCRLESLVQLCEALERQQAWATIYVLARHKRGIVNGDTLFVDPRVERRIVELHGLAALRLGCKEEAASDFLFVLSGYCHESADLERVGNLFEEARA